MIADSLSSYHCRNLSSCLIRRELKGPCRSNDLQDAVVKRIARNITQGNHCSRVISTAESGYAFQHHDYLVTVKRDLFSLELWNIAFGKKVWQCQSAVQSIFQNRVIHLDSTLIDENGIVAPIYSVRSHDTPLNVEERYMEIFFEGKKTGEKRLPNSTSVIQMQNGHIFAIGFDLNEENSPDGTIHKEKRNIYEWDHTGTEIHKLSLAQLADNQGQTIAINEDYLVICAGTMNKPLVDPKIFVFDFKTERQGVYHLETPDPIGSWFMIGSGSIFDQNADSENYIFTSIYLLENHLYLGTCREKKVPSHNFKMVIDPALTVFNLFSGRVENKYRIHRHSGINNLLIHGNSAYFRCHGLAGKDSLCSLDLNAYQSFENIFWIPKRYGHDLHLSIYDNLLAACYRDSAEIQVKAILNTQTGQIIRRTTYQRYAEESKIALQSGLVMATETFADQVKFSVYDYHFFVEKETEIASMIKTKNFAKKGCCCAIC